jgi:hypothetical protein
VREARVVPQNSLGLIALAVALLVSSVHAANSWKSVKEKPFERSISVTGSARKRITSDLIEWSAVVEVRAADRTECYRTLHQHVEKTLAFLRGKGIKAEDMFPQSVSFSQLFENEVRVVDKERIERQIATGWSTEQAVKIRSNDVKVVEVASREVTSLLEQGISVRSSEPAYFYTKLGELKVEMLAAAAEDARTRADNIVKSAGGARIGDLLDADMGVINVNSANSSTTSWDGNNDTGSLEKDIFTIVHAKFTLK